MKRNAGLYNQRKENQTGWKVSKSPPSLSEDTRRNKPALQRARIRAIESRPERI